MILEGQVVVITGAGPGLGRRMAVRAAREGADVVLAARSSQTLEVIVREVEEVGGRALAVPCDVRDATQVQGLVDAAVERFGTITGLVSSAYAHPGLSDVLDTPDAQLRRCFDVIVHGALEVTRVVVPVMREGGGGAIVNVGTMATRKPRRGEGAYAMAKAAMATATTYLATELGEHGIRVNHAAMGWLDGPAVQYYTRSLATERGTDVETVRAEIAAGTALGRVPSDEACTGAVLYLLSDLASEVTGATIDVNGGEFMP